MRTVFRQARDILTRGGRYYTADTEHSGSGGRSTVSSITRPTVDTSIRFRIPSPPLLVKEDYRDYFQAEGGKIFLLYQADIHVSIPG